MWHQPLAKLPAGNYKTIELGSEGDNFTEFGFTISGEVLVEPDFDAASGTIIAQSVALRILKAPTIDRSNSRVAMIRADGLKVPWLNYSPSHLTRIKRVFPIGSSPASFSPSLFSALIDNSKLWQIYFTLSKCPRSLSVLNRCIAESGRRSLKIALERSTSSTSSWSNNFNRYTYWPPTGPAPTY